MSHISHIEHEETVYEAGYEKGYSDCQSELSFKIKAVLRTYLYSPKLMSPTELSKQIGEILDGQ